MSDVSAPRGAGLSTPETRPSTPARVYDWLLDGVHHFPADQEVGRQIVAQNPLAKIAVRANRDFLCRGVRYLAADAGIRQFLDLGSGIPTEGNVHEIAQAIAPDARVVYVDVDPVAVSESQEMLEGNRYATAIKADMRDVDAIIAHPRLRKTLDLSQPFAVLLASVLHFLADDEQVTGLVRRLVAAMPPGSHLLVSHGASEQPTDPARLEQIVQVYERKTATSGRTRTREEVTDLFTGLTLVEPGVVWAPQWRPDRGDDPLRAEPARSCMWCGIGRRP